MGGGGDGDGDGNKEQRDFQTETTQKLTVIYSRK